MLIPTKIIGLIGLLLTLSPSILAQGSIWVSTGDSSYDYLGYSAVEVGDVNGDGVPDILAGVEGDDPNGQESGSARILSGTTGNLIFNFDGDNQSDSFGWQVGRCGDVNGDGVSDYAISAPGDDNLAPGGGMVRVFAGGSGAQLYQFDGTTTDEMLGTSLGYLGDVNGDGRADILIGATQKSIDVTGASAYNGYITVKSGADGSTLYTVAGTSTNDQFGFDCAGGRDLNGDGVNDLIVGAYGEDTGGLNAGSVTALSGLDGSLLWTAYGDSARDHMGAYLDIIGDVNGDNVPDVAAGAPEDDNNGANAGAVHVLSGANGAKIGLIDGETRSDQFGSSVAGFADINGDGVEEFLAGASLYDGQMGPDSGRLYVIDGATLSVFMVVDGALAGDRMGWACGGGSDYDGDGIPDFFGACVQYFAQGGNNGRGYVSLHDTVGTPPPPPPAWAYLPTTFIPLGANGYSEDFEALAGIVPSHMAVNALDMFFRTDDPEAWCNIGQNAPSITTNSGSFALELGGNPVMSAHHEVANGLVIGIDGTGSSSLTLDFHAYNWGEESHNDDGVWLSSNGLDWESVLASWGSVAQSGNWEAVTGIDLTTTSVDTTQPFYLLFAQADNYEYGTADGIGIDDIVVKEWAPPGPTLSVTPAQPVAGQPAQLVVEFNQPSDMVVIAYSFIGGGPTNTPYGTLYLTPPFGQLPSLFANANGVAGLLANVPPTVSGFNLWLHSLNFTQSVWTNPIATSIL